MTSEPSMYGLERLEHATSGELAVEPVVHQEQVWRRPAGDRGRETCDQVVAVARLDELDVDVRVLFLEGPDHRAVDAISAGSPNTSNRMDPTRSPSRRNPRQGCTSGEKERLR